MTATDTREFTVSLESGSAYLLEAEQHDLDLLVAITDPAGTVRSFDSPLLRQASELVLIEPQTSGTHRVRLHSNEFTGANARVIVRLDRIEPTDSTDALELDALRAWAEGSLAFARAELAHWRAAKSSYRKALSHAQASGNREFEARTWLALSNLLYLQLTDWNAALEAGRRAAVLYEALGSEAQRASAIHLQCAALIEVINEIPQATEDSRARATVEVTFSSVQLLCDQAAAIHSRLGNDYERARVLNDLGLAFHYRGDWETARPYFGNAATLFKKDDEWSEEIKPLNNLALIDYERGRLTDALASFTRILALLPPEGLDWLRGDILDNMGTAYRALGDVEKALASYTQALDLHEARGALKAQGSSLSGLGVTYYSAGDLALARRYLEQALPVRRQANDGRGEASTLRYLGAIYLAQGETERAIDAHQRVLAMATAPADEARARALLGRDYVSARRLVEARDNLSRAVAHAEEAGAMSVLADALVERGALFADLGELPAAQRDLARATQYFDDLGLLGGAARADYELGRLALARGDTEGATDFASRAIAQVERQRSAILAPDLRAAYLGGRQGYYDLLVDALLAEWESTSEVDVLRAALEANERSRTRSMLDLLAEASVQADDELAPQWREQRQRRHQALAQLRYRHEELLERNAPREEIQGVLADLNRVETALNLLEIEIRERNPRYAELSAPESLTAREIQKQLGDDSLLLQYSLGSPDSHVFAVTSSTITAERLASADRIDRLARDVHQRLRTYAPGPRSRTELSAALDELAGELLAPVAELLATRSRVVIVADGALGYLPFALLPVTWQNDRPRALLASHEVITLPSMTVLAARRSAKQPRSPPTRTIAVFADPVFAASDPRLASLVQATAADAAVPRQSMSVARLKNLGRLNATAAEARTIASLVPPAERLIATDFDATREAALSPQLADFRVVHFATHGLIDTRYPALSALVLSLIDPHGQPRDGLVRLQDIYGLRLNASLAVLSACDTALGSEISGEGLIGLTRGFLHAGARTVVASLWQVPDRATAELMQRFYRFLFDEGLAPAAALRRAQIDLSGQPRWRDPYFWAAFVAQGDWATDDRVR